MDREFISVYGNVGYYLRTSETNTSSRIAMLASLVHLQNKAKAPVPFDEFYELSLEMTDEKLEMSSFKSFISKLEGEKGENLILEVKMDDETAFQCSDTLLSDIEKAEKEFDSIVP